MKGFGLGLLVLIVSIFYLDAFLPPFHPPSTTTSRQQASKRLESPNDEGLQSNMEHGDILWKLRPPKESSRRKRLWTRFAANLIRLDCLIKRQEMPLVLCPKGGQVVLEAHYRPNNNTNNNNSKRYKQIARFGFTTMAGPSNQPIQDTVHDLYGLSADRQYRVGAIIYMFVEEGYRKREVGKLALEVIALIQSIQACDFTMLVADDNGTGKLIEWYHKNGYQRAPQLQAMLGSPNAIHGVTMMAATNRELPRDCKIKWW